MAEQPIKFQCFLIEAWHQSPVSDWTLPSRFEQERDDLKTGEARAFETYALDLQTPSSTNTFSPEG